MEAVETEDGIQAELVKRKAFDKEYNIAPYNTDDKLGHLDLVRYHPALDYVSGGPVELLYRKYARSCIHTVFGLNVEEFMDLPKAEADWMLEFAEEVSQKTK